MGRTIERSAARSANKRIHRASTTHKAAHDGHDTDDTCSLASDDEFGDSDEEELDDSDLDHTLDAGIPVAPAASSTNAVTTSGVMTRKRAASMATTTSSAPSSPFSTTSTTSMESEYTYPSGIQFAAVSKSLLKGKDLLLCTSLGWTNGRSPSASAAKRSGLECAKDLKRITYGDLDTEVRAKKFRTGMEKEKKNVGAASQKAVKTWNYNSRDYRRVFNALFNGGGLGNSRYGGGKMRMGQLTPGVVLHERLHGDQIGHSNRWRKLNKKELEKFNKILRRKGGVAPKGYTQINGEWNIFESSRDGFCSVMNIYGKRNNLPVPIMKKLAFREKQLAIYPIGSEPVTYNLQNVMKEQRDGVLNGVQIMLGGSEEPLYLGLYTSKMRKAEEPSTLLAFHTATGKGRNVGSTRWGLGKNLTLSEMGVYARVVEEGADVWKVEVGRIATDAAETREMKRLRM